MDGALYIRCVGDRNMVLSTVRDYLKQNGLEDRCFSECISRLPGTRSNPGLPDKTWQDCIGTFNLSSSDADDLQRYLIDKNLADKFDYTPYSK